MKKRMTFEQACETVEDAKRYGTNENRRRIVNWFRNVHGETAIRAAKRSMDDHPEDAKALLDLMLLEGDMS